MRSERGYAGLSGVWHVVARTAYTQLAYSPMRLLGTVVALLLAFAAPPIAVAVAGVGFLAGAALQPSLRHSRLEFLDGA